MPNFLNYVGNLVDNENWEARSSNKIIVSILVIQEIVEVWLEHEMLKKP